MLKVNCPTCQTAIEWKAENTFRPFCSKRCQLIDLGEWASEGYSVPELNANINKAQQPLTPEQIEDIEAMLIQQESHL